MLHHDNAPCHTPLSICQFLAGKNTPVLPPPAYCHNLSTCDFWYSSNSRKLCKGTNTTRRLRVIPKEDFHKCFQKRWNNCVGAGGEYFEGDWRRNAYSIIHETFWPGLVFIVLICRSDDTFTFMRNCILENAVIDFYRSQ
jgi:hypothetical protein